MRAGDTHGLLRLRTPSQHIAHALERHIARRVSATERVLVRSWASSTESVFRDACAQLGVDRVPADPVAAARALRDAAHHAVLVVAGELRGGGWDEAVVRELEANPGRALLLWIRWEGQGPDALGGPDEVHVGGLREDHEAWWGGVVQEALARDEAETIADLDAWWSWSSPRMSDAPRPDLSSISDQARQVVSRLRLAGRAWPSRDKLSLGARAAWAELLDLEAVLQHRGYVRLAPDSSSIEVSASPEDAMRVADALRARFSRDAWALARAGALYTRAGEPDSGQRCLEQSLRALDDTLARHEVWDGWRQALRDGPAEKRRQGAMFAAELAIERDDVDTALDLAHLAGAGDPNAPFTAQYVLGRAQLARGDVAAARVALERAYVRAEQDNERAAALAQLAEASYTLGDLDDAARKAREASSMATEPAVRIDASNTTGKVLLARAQWAEAEAHFAGDESAAAAAELPLSQLRARVNRAIALLSKGQAEGARGILDAVLIDAEQRRDLRATAFALSNLAVLAIDRHDYANALLLSERAIDARRRLGDRVGLARVVTNLAELRLRLGLVTEANQTLTFGRHALHPGIPPTRASHFALVTARIRLAQGDTLEATRKIVAALADADGSSDGAMVGECHRVDARIALEDGDLDRARCSIREAGALADEAFPLAEVALLEAKLAQANGRDASGLAQDALAQSRRAGDEDLLRESHVLVAELCRIQGRSKAARRHVNAAKQIRDRVADTLPDSLRARYLARPDWHRLHALEDAIGIAAERKEAPDEPPESVGRSHRTADRAQPRFVGKHPSVVRLLGAVGKVARSSSPALVCGESGTGKELIAEALHAESDRHDAPLVKVNCAALVDSLLLSELFGHEKGAFTGAASRRRGRFELADGGTLFLDEIGDISARTQVALLRVLQDNVFERVGGSTPIRTDVRVVCATHRDLKQMVAEGTFREDLYYRLGGVTLRVPALRDRPSDIPGLAEHLLRQVAEERNEAPTRLSREALAVLQKHRWPGNVRELDNALRAASLFTEGDEISADTMLEHVPVRSEEVFPNVAPSTTRSDLPPPATLRSVAEPDIDQDASRLAFHQIRKGRTNLGDLKRDIERECIRQALAETEGNITRAAALLGMKRPRLSQLVKQYSLLDSSSEDAS